MIYLKKHSTLILLFGISLVSLFFAIYKFNEVPMCLNADEVSFGYNAYSILKTGKDEFGNFLPLRFTSFGDNKLPLYGYATVPILALFGYSDSAVRGLNVLLTLLFVPSIFFVTKKLFQNRHAGFVASFLFAVNPGIHVLSRHAHEGVLCLFLILWSLYFFLRFKKSHTVNDFLILNALLFLSTLAYHFGRIFLIVFILYELFYIVKKRDALRKNIISFFVIIVLTLGISFGTDIFHGASRISSLAFYSDPGFELRINELRSQHPSRLVHNKLTQGVQELKNNYFEQISPEFLVLHGDSNDRFGMPNFGPITIIELLFFYIGVYVLFQKKNPQALLLMGLIAISPLANALTWQDPSLLRSYPLILFILIVSSYGFVCFWKNSKTIFMNQRILILFKIGSVVLFLFLLSSKWDLYFNHYTSLPSTSRAWQCGYKEAVEVVKRSYDQFDSIVVSKKIGQPYIFFLHYLQFDPKTYQSSQISFVDDEYGFKTVESFDKFKFNFDYDVNSENTLYVGTPNEMESLSLPEKEIKKIQINNEDVFWIYPIGEKNK